MPGPYPLEFRHRAIALLREGRQVKQTAQVLGVHEVTLHTRLRQDDIDHGRRPGHSSRESAELRAARNREPGVSREKIAADFGIHPITLSTWLKKADIYESVKPGIRAW